jgi:glycosyltransferase involved in cell wall biosynthesis
VFVEKLDMSPVFVRHASSRGFRGADNRAHYTAPLVSVLVVVLRDRVELQQLIDNLGPFRGPDLEVIVIDGGSDDGSLELLEERSLEVDYWLSEKDSGIYEAMNKAIANARGRFVLHMNAGDRLLEVPYEQLRAAHDDVAAIAGAIVSEHGIVHQPDAGSRLKRTCSIHHQGTFYRRSAHLGYDAGFRMAADFDHNLRMKRAGLRFELSKTVVSMHTEGGISEDPQFFHEHIACVRKHIGSWQVVLLQMSRWRAIRLLRYAFELGSAVASRSRRRRLLKRMREASRSPGEPPQPLSRP